MYGDTFLYLAQIDKLLEKLLHMKQFGHKAQKHTFFFHASTWRYRQCTAYA